MASEQPESVHGAEASEALSSLEITDARKAAHANGTSNGGAGGTENSVTESEAADNSSMEEDKRPEPPAQNGGAVSATVG